MRPRRTPRPVPLRWARPSRAVRRLPGASRLSAGQMWRSRGRRPASRAVRPRAALGSTPARRRRRTRRTGWRDRAPAPRARRRAGEAPRVPEAVAPSLDVPALTTNRRAHRTVERLARSQTNATIGGRGCLPGVLRAIERRGAFVRSERRSHPRCAARVVPSERQICLQGNLSRVGNESRVVSLLGASAALGRAVPRG